mmetsp:Transcript_21463/g.31122  ORF Transcript_21463/g.31122 Transcript_21463/m.31122 type:complete len:84 (+) Transcript_21463:129-380(+)
MDVFKFAMHIEILHPPITNRPCRSQTTKGANCFSFGTVGLASTGAHKEGSGLFLPLFDDDASTNLPIVFEPEAMRWKLPKWSP